MRSISKYAASIFAAAVVLASTAAHASFHLWVFDQIYSDASGTVQYVQFSTTSAGQELMTLTSLQATLGMATNSFPSRLTFRSRPARRRTRSSSWRRKGS